MTNSSIRENELWTGAERIRLGYREAITKAQLKAMRCELRPQQQRQTLEAILNDIRNLMSKTADQLKVGQRQGGEYNNEKNKNKDPIFLEQDWLF